MDQPVCLVDLGLGNLGSVTNMVTRAGAQVQRASTPDALIGANKVILPGVGSFDAMVRKLDAAGFRQPLLEHARLGKPLLGICLGMQLLADGSDEGQLPGLGLIPGRVRRFCFEGELAHLNDVLFETNHGHDFASGVQRGNVMGAQFHPEKSHRFGLQLIKNFVEL
jgi:glutamine amidotransferase